MRRKASDDSLLCCRPGPVVCRYIQVGNEFNGLYTEAKEKPSELLDVPLEIFGKPKALDPSRGATASLLIETLGLRRRRMLRTQEEKGRAWLQGSYLAVRALYCSCSPYWAA